MYAPKAVPEDLLPLISTCVGGNLQQVQALWRPQDVRTCLELNREETCNPLLVSAHHLRVDIVEFLLKQGLNPRQRGTVHPYTGDGLTVAELQGACVRALPASVSDGPS